jgi:hypothetical protein
LDTHRLKVHASGTASCHPAPKVTVVLDYVRWFKFSLSVSDIATDPNSLMTGAHLFGRGTSGIVDICYTTAAPVPRKLGDEPLFNRPAPSQRRSWPQSTLNQQLVFE